MAKNDNLHKAKDAKNDEFYTRIEDVAEELRHYKKHFAGKVVLCNCDDPTWSAFWRYFHLNFAELGLKKLISTHYDRTEPTYKMEYEGGDDNNVEVGVKTPLEGNGDFRNKECLDFLDESDIVVTNPPFSLFREYVAVLMKHQKKFLILGNMNALTYKEIFPLVRDNQLWYGASIHSGDRKFYVPNDYPLKASGCGVDNNGQKFIRVKGVRWYTNLDYKARHEKLVLWKNYTPEEYPKYDNYDAINNGYSYQRIAGLPITNEIWRELDIFDDIDFVIIETYNSKNTSKKLAEHHGQYFDKSTPKPKIYPAFSFGLTNITSMDTYAEHREGKINILFNMQANQPKYDVSATKTMLKNERRKLDREERKHFDKVTKDFCK